MMTPAVAGVSAIYKKVRIYSIDVPVVTARRSLLLSIFVIKGEQGISFKVYKY
jgi:hypothetical protein